MISFHFIWKIKIDKKRKIGEVYNLKLNVKNAVDYRKSKKKRLNNTKVDYKEWIMFNEFIIFTIKTYDQFYSLMI